MITATTLKKLQAPITALLIIAAIFSALQNQGNEISIRWKILALFILMLMTVTHLFTHYARANPLTKNYSGLSYSLLMLWSLASLLWSPVPSDSLLFWITQVTGVFALYIGYQMTSRQWGYLKGLLIPLALIVAGYTLYQSQILDISRPSGFMLNWNSNAAFLALLMLPFCAGFLTVEQTSKRHALGLFLLICALAMAVTQSRGGLLVLLFGVLPIAWSQRGTPQKLWHLGQLSAYLIIGYAVAEFLQSGALLQRLAAQAGSAGLNAETLKTLGSGRHALWLAGWQMYLDRPLLGWGLGLFHWLYPQYRDPLLLEKGHLAHNDYLDTLLGLGPLGLLLLLLFVGSVARLFWRALKRNDTEQLALSGAALGILAHSFFSFNLYQPALIIVLGLYVGYLNQITQSQTLATAPAQHFSKPLYFGLTGIFTVIFSAWLLSLTMGFFRAEQALKQITPDKRIQYLSQAQQWLPYMAYYDAVKAETLMNLLKRKKPEDLTPEELGAMLDFTADTIDQLESKNPLDANIYRNRGDLLLFNAKTKAQTQLAIDNYLLALQYNPYDLDTRYKLSQLLENQEREPEAYRLLFEGLDKAYFASPKAGLQLLTKIKQILATTRPTKAQTKALDDQIQDLLTRSMRYKVDNFVLRKIGIPLQ